MSLWVYTFVDMVYMSRERESVCVCVRVFVGVSVCILLSAGKGSQVSQPPIYPPRAKARGPAWIGPLTKSPAHPSGPLC